MCAWYRQKSVQFWFTYFQKQRGRRKLNVHGSGKMRSSNYFFLFLLLSMACVWHVWFLKSHKLVSGVWTSERKKLTLCSHFRCFLVSHSLTHEPLYCRKNVTVFLTSMTGFLLAALHKFCSYFSAIEIEKYKKKT